MVCLHHRVHRVEGKDRTDDEDEEEGNITQVDEQNNAALREAQRQSLLAEQARSTDPSVALNFHTELLDDAKENPNAMTIWHEEVLM
jgi:hypothetical protein